MVVTTGVSSKGLEGLRVARLRDHRAHACYVI